MGDFFIVATGKVLEENDPTNMRDVRGFTQVLNKSSSAYCSFGGLWSGRYCGLTEMNCFFVIWLVLWLVELLTQGI